MSRSIGRPVMLVAAAAAIWLGLLAWPSGAAADGDPASDVLASQSLFLPQDSGATAAQQGSLDAVLRAARRSSYGIRVAVIARPSDLGSVGALWHRPQSYAQFLGQELALTYRGTLLVVMPDGFGVYHDGRPVAAERAALARVPPGGTTRLLTATQDATRAVAAATGHRLNVVSSGPAGGSGSSQGATWLALALGGVLIAAAWTASLRARPPNTKSSSL